MERSVRTLLTHPREFYSTRRGNPDHLFPALIVAATGAMTLFAQLLLVSMSVIGDRPTVTYVTTALQIELPAITVAGSLISFGHVFIYWVIYAAVFYLASTQFADGGSFRELFWLTGWGFLPWAIAGVVWLGAMIVSAHMTPVPATPAENDLFVQQVQQTALVETTQYLDYLGTVWSLALWTQMVRVVRDVTPIQAIAAVSPIAAFELAKILLL